MMNTDRIYFNAPAPIQNLMASAAGVITERRRYGDPFSEAEIEYLDRSSWNYESLSHFRRSRRALALARASNTQFYSRVFFDMDAEWHELISDDAFKQIPITTKAHVQANPGEFFPRRAVSSDALMRTSGTTGTPLAIAQSRSAVVEQWAVWWRYRNWHGIPRGEKFALFAGRRIMRSGQGRPYWRYNLAGRELRFSTYHISPETAKLYVAQLNRYAPRWIHGYSSALATLAQLMLDQGLSLSAPVRWVTLGGENVTTIQMHAIERAFGASPIQHYGMAEGAANISTCKEGRLHIDEDFADVDFATDASGLTRILGTPLANTAMSLLRYDTGDLGGVVESDVCDCDYGGRVVRSFDGRGDDAITLPDGTVVGTPEDAFQSGLDLAQAQIVQHVNGSLTVRYVPEVSWGPKSAGRLEDRLRQYYGQDIVINFHPVRVIPSEPNGKTRLVKKENAYRND